jgi:exosortase
MSSAPSVAPWATLSPRVKFSVLLLAALTVALCVLLWPHWRHNADLSHGLFMPVVFLLLLRESRAGTARFLPAGRLTTGALAATLGAGLLALVASGLYAAALGWSHDLVAFTLTGSLVLFLAAGLMVFATDSVRLVPANWSAAIALLLWLLSAPIPPGTYTRLTLGLQLLVSENVLNALHLLGIAAVRHGNILELASTSVGIEEACSGVRSLISCVFAGLFFSASLVRRPGSRAFLIGLAAPLALVMNFVRSLTLTLLANAGVSIAGTWHDLTGFAVLGVTAALLGGLALMLERKSEPARGAPTEPIGQASAVQPGPARLLAGALALAVTLVVFFYANTRPARHRDTPVPDLSAILPLRAEGWQVVTTTDLYQFSDTLQTDHLAQRTYTRTTDQGTDQIIVYLAYWRPGQASVSLVASHTPDACWPGSGWESIPVPEPRVQLTAGARQLPEAEARFFQSADFPQHVWFWHLYDGRPITQQNPNSPAELLRLAWRYGFHHDGDQLFVRVSSNRSWDAIAREPVLETLFARLQPLGL